MLALSCLQAVDCGCVPQLLQLLASDHMELACAAAEALMMITLAREGKVATHEVSQSSHLLHCRSVEQQWNLYGVCLSLLCFHLEGCSGFDNCGIPRIMA